MGKDKEEQDFSSNKNWEKSLKELSKKQKAKADYEDIADAEERKKYLEELEYSRNFFCKDCSYLWTSKKSIGIPARCPGCSSKNIRKTIC